MAQIRALQHPAACLVWKRAASRHPIGITASSTPASTSDLRRMLHLYVFEATSVYGTHGQDLWDFGSASAKKKSSSGEHLARCFFAGPRTFTGYHWAKWT